MNLFRIIIYILLFVLLSINFPTSICYLLFAFLLGISLIRLALHPKIPKIENEDVLAFGFVLVWAYGFFVGIIKGNEINYVVSNFAGMICYSIYFVLVICKCSAKSLTKVLYYAGVIVSIYVSIRFFASILGYNTFSFNLNGGVSSTGQVRFYFPVLAVSFCPLGASICMLVMCGKKNDVFKKPINKYSAFVVLVLSVIAVFIVPASKGFLLGGIFFVLTIPLLVYGERLRKLKMSPVFFFVCVFMIVALCVMLVKTDYISIVENMFTKDDYSNSYRYNELDYLMKDMCFLGNGLGATVPGVVMDSSAPYGFELTYINLIHKFGLMSLILFANWLYMFCCLSKFIYKNNHVLVSVVAFCALGYMFPAIGNPILMHPALVMMNCMTLYMIRTIRLKGYDIGLHANI